jgi:hypothetical protein
MAYDFTAASSQYASISDTSVLDIASAITLCAWIKSSGTYGTGGKGVISKNETTTNQRSYALGLNSSGNVQFSVSHNGTGARSEWNSSVVGTSWRHISASYNTTGRIVAIYLDGQVQSRSNNAGTLPTSIFTGSAPLWIGLNATTSTSPNNFFFDGMIAEVAIYNSALTAAEIDSISKGMSCDKIRPQSLVFYAPLVRDLIDPKGGLTITNNNGATVANHPRVYA